MLRASHGGSSRGLLFHGSFVRSLPPWVLQAPSREPSCSKVRISALKSPKGFGPPAPKSTKPLPAEEKTEMIKGKQILFDDSGATAGDDEDDEVPEIVMDRMLKRIGVSIAIPLVLAVLMFPFFYYLKVQLRLDVPEWLPLLVSGSFFGSAALGITYGIVSTSWDPLRDGSLLGWKEAKTNWPLFFSNLQGKRGRGE